MSWFPWFGWTRVQVCREAHEGVGLLVTELWFNWWTKKHQIRSCVICGLKFGKLTENQWFADQVARIRESAKPTP